MGSVLAALTRLSKDHARVWLPAALLIVASGLDTPTRAGAPAIRYLDQGHAWTPERRNLFYSIDQGSQLIPLSWLEALKQADGKPFLDGSLARYGFLPTEDPARTRNLPIGFATNLSDRGPIVGLTCAACHTRQIDVDKTTYRIDGAPAIIDFATFAADLDKAMTRVRGDDADFRPFTEAVLGTRAKDANAVAMLRADVDLWWVRYHTFISKSLPSERLWGPARMDAISLIYNRLAGLDNGPPPTYLILGNIEVGDAPVRYPFLWNAWRQDITQWTGFAANGNDFYALTRNLGQEYGVFGTFHPQRTTGTFTIFNRNYLAENSANIGGLKMAETLLHDLKPPPWPWPVDQVLADKGKAIFERPEKAGGCAECHGIVKGNPKYGTAETVATRVVVVDTDTRSWKVALRQIDTGSMEGATIPNLVPPLKKRDGALALVRAGVVGAVVQDQKAVPQVEAQAAAFDDPKARIHVIAKDKLGFGFIKAKAAIQERFGFGPPPPPPLVVNGYEARILPGIWAAAPYLHNGSVPTLADLLKPAAERPAGFKVGTTYDPQRVGLAAKQTGLFDFTQTTTGCEDMASGDSRCGHEYGTSLPAEDKKALLEYLKTL